MKNQFINPDILKMAKSLRSDVERQKGIALEMLNSLPEGDQKESLTKLLNRALKGNVNFEDAQREIQKILNNARSN